MSVSGQLSGVLSAVLLVLLCSPSLSTAEEQKYRRCGDELVRTIRSICSKNGRTCISPGKGFKTVANEKRAEQLREVPEVLTGTARQTIERMLRDSAASLRHDLPWHRSEDEARGRFKRAVRLSSAGVAKECCTKTCPLSYLQKYCCSEKEWTQYKP